MSGRGWPAAAGRWLPWVGVVALVGALWAHRSALEGARAQAADLRGPAQRTLVSDRLIGSDLSEARVTTVDGGEAALHGAEGWHVVWFVDPAECPRCLARTGPWRELVAAPELTGTVVLAGTDGRGARRTRRRAGLAGRVTADPRGALSASAGLDRTTPAVFAVLDTGGSVVMAEARRAGTSCGWSFPRQVRALLAGGDASRLRREAP